MVGAQGLALRITNEARNLSLVRKAVVGFLEKSAFDERLRGHLVLAIDESVANVIEHAYGRDRGLLEINLELDEERLRVRVRDQGEPFVPTDAKILDLNEHLRLGLDGGLGLFLMRKVMDEVRYSSTSRYTNELDMIKFVPGREG